jgi:hypothetical protein
MPGKGPGAEVRRRPRRRPATLPGRRADRGPPVSVRERLVKWARRRPAAAALALVVALAALAVPAGVRHVGFSRDGKTILTGCSDARTRLWEVGVAEPRWHVTSKDHVWGVAFHPDGRHFVAATGGVGVEDPTLATGHGKRTGPPAARADPCGEGLRCNAAFLANPFKESGCDVTRGCAKRSCADPGGVQEIRANSWQTCEFLANPHRQGPGTHFPESLLSCLPQAGTTVDRSCPSGAP